ATATVPATATAFPTSTPPATATTPPTPTAVPTTAPTATQLPTQTPFPTSTPAPTATPQPTATIVPTVAATATATPSPTTTSTPNSRATATAVASAIAVATPAYELPFHSLTYPRGDALKVYPDPGDEEDVGFDVEDFVVDVTFVNPEPGPDETWDYGILFGPTDKNEYYRVYARADGRWFVDLGDETLREGEARRLDLNDGEANTFRLIVSDSRGILFINDRYVGSFELGSGSSQRTVWLATTNLDGRDLAFRDLSIWSFP
ncbi:MAG: eukaryotic-like serine/threonine-protein kinase, partial [Thermomicrobiales bacterium]|nr:eukaryotic-like serine/threonine-protein kinase [Thermomicrobiales bacterium]